MQALQGDSGKEWLKRWVFKRFLKTDTDVADVTFSGRVFQSRAAATGKARSPMVERRVRGTTSDDVDAERRCWRASSADDWWSSSATYGGAVWCRHLYARTANLNSIRSGTFMYADSVCVTQHCCTVYRYEPHCCPVARLVLINPNCATKWNHRSGLAASAQP